MFALLRLLIALALVGVFIVGFFYFVAKLIGGLVFNPESRAWRELLAKLRDRLRKRSPESLVTCNTENLSQLSLKPKILKKAGWRDEVFEGVFSTIYQEPVLIYAGQRSGKTAAIVARTAEHEFIFRQKGKETEIWQDGQPYAVFVNNTLLAAGSSGKMLAKLEPNPELRQWPVLMGHHEAAELTNAERAISPIPRALDLLRPLTPEEEKALLLLTVLKGA